MLKAENGSGSPRSKETELTIHTGIDNDGEDGIHHPDEQSQLIPTSTTDETSTKRRVVKKTATGRTLVKRKVRSTEANDPKHVFIKYMALLLLVGQMVGLVLLMRYSRTVPRPEDQPLYLASSAVFVMEVMKLVICVLVIAYQANGALLQELRVHILQSPMELVKLCVPSLLYTVQNNLLYLALTNLDAATYQVCYQLKILTTALFSAILLQRKFSSVKVSPSCLVAVFVFFAVTQSHVFLLIVAFASNIDHWCCDRAIVR
jgi:hypothetical protein